MTTRYRFDPAHSRFTAQAFAAGMLSFLGHSPTFTVGDFTGVVASAADRVEGLQLDLTVGAAGLAVGEDVKPADRREIEDRMRADVLDTARYPEITYHASPAAAERLAAGRYRMTLEGTLSLRGVSRPHRVAAELAIFGDGLRLRGDTGLRMSDYEIPPVTALGGTIRLRDEVKLTFDLAAVPEAP